MALPIHIIWLDPLSDKSPALIRECIHKFQVIYGFNRVKLWNKDMINREFPAMLEWQPGKQGKAAKLKKAQYCDLARLEILLKYGGTYFDSDIYPFSYDPLVDNEEKCGTYKEGIGGPVKHQNECNNGLIHAPYPNHPAIKAYRDEAFEKVVDIIDVKNMNPSDRWALIGPRMLTKIVLDDKSQWVIYPMSKYQLSLGESFNRMRIGKPFSKPSPDAYGIHMFHSQWHTLRIRSCPKLEIDGVVYEF